MSNSLASDVSQITEEQKISYVDLEGRTPDETYQLLYPDKHLEETVWQSRIMNMRTTNCPKPLFLIEIRLLCGPCLKPLPVNKVGWYPIVDDWYHIVYRRYHCCEQVVSLA